MGAAGWKRWGRWRRSDERDRLANGTAVSAGELNGAAAMAMAWRTLGGCATVTEKPEKRNGKRRVTRASAGDVKVRSGLAEPHTARRR